MNDRVSTNSLHPSFLSGLHSISSAFSIQKSILFFYLFNIWTKIKSQGEGGVQERATGRFSFKVNATSPISRLHPQSQFDADCKSFFFFLYFFVKFDRKVRFLLLQIDLDWLALGFFALDWEFDYWVCRQFHNWLADAFKIVSFDCFSYDQVVAFHGVLPFPPLFDLVFEEMTILWATGT